MPVYELIVNFLCRCVKLLFAQLSPTPPPPKSLVAFVQIFGGMKELRKKRGFSDSFCMPCVWFVVGISEIIE